MPGGFTLKKNVSCLRLPLKEEIGVTMCSHAPEHCHPEPSRCYHWIFCLAFLALTICLSQPGCTQEATPANLDLTKNGQYASGGWAYVYSITNPGSRSEGTHGVLSYRQTELSAPVHINDFYETPWGRLYWVGKPNVLFGAHGWMPKALAREPVGQAMMDPAIASHARFVIRVKVLTQDTLATPDRLEQDPAVLEALKPFGLTQGHIQKDWFQMGQKLVTLHDTKRWGSLTVRRADPNESLIPALECQSRNDLTVDTSPRPSSLEDIAATLELSTMLEDLTAGPKTKIVRLSPQIETLQPLKCTLPATIGGDLVLFLVCQIQDREKPLYLGPDMHGKTVTVTGQHQVVIQLPGNATTGFAWTLVSLQGNAVKHIGPIDYTPTPQTQSLVGAGGLFKASFEVVKSGTAKIRLGYQRPWETSQSPVQTFDVTLMIPNDPNQPNPPLAR